MIKLMITGLARGLWPTITTIPMIMSTIMIVMNIMMAKHRQSRWGAKGEAPLTCHEPSLLVYHEQSAFCCFTTGGADSRMIEDT